MCINCCINYIIINFKYNKNYKEEGDVMEIKKLILSLLFISLLSGCNLLESEVECNKNINSENFNYNIDMRLIFDNKDELKRVVSNIKYQLTDKGLENIDTMEETLKEKKKTYDKGAYVKVEYNIKNGIIDLT